MGLGLFMLIGGAAAGMVYDLASYAWLGLLFACGGSALLVLASWAMRGLSGETLVRSVTCLALALGGIHVITGLLALGVVVKAGSGFSGYTTGTAMYSICFGAICMAAFVVINYDSRSRQKQDANSPAGSAGDIR